MLTADGGASAGYTGVNAHGGAHVMRLKNSKTPGWEMDVKTLGVEAGAGADLMKGAKLTAGAHLVDADVGVFRARLGVGVDTGVTVKDDTVDATLAGTGLKIGRHMGVQVLGNEFSVDMVGVAKAVGGWFGL